MKTLGFFNILTITLLLAGCAAQPANQELAQAWIDAPLDGSHIPNSVYTIVGHASSANGISLFELQIDDGAAILVLPLAQGGTLAQMQSAWQPPGPGTYLIRLRAAENLEDYGPVAEAMVIVDGPEEEQPEQITETATPMIEENQLRLIAIPDPSANCRLGASSQFDIIDTVVAGVEYEPLARGYDNQWVLFNGPVSERKCWVYSGNLRFFINEDEISDLTDVPEELLPYTGYPATPTPIPDDSEDEITPTPTGIIIIIPPILATPTNTPIFVH